MGAKKEILPIPRLDQGVYLVDTHCHLEMGEHGRDWAGVIARSRGAGVGKLVTIGIDCATSRLAAEIAGQSDGVYAAVGIHPHNVSGIGDEDYAELTRLARLPKVVAFGEIGMDLVKKYAPEDEQREHFARQAVLGRDLGLPLIIHDREAHDEVLAILAAAAPFPRGGVMHCFSGDIELARKVIDLGFHISIPGVVTYPSAESLREVAANIPLDRLLLETDAPFLAPEPRRGRTNEPAYLPYTAQRVADLRKMTLTELARATTANAARVFGLPVE